MSDRGPGLGGLHAWSCGQEARVSRDLWVERGLFAGLPLTPKAETMGATASSISLGSKRPVLFRLPHPSRTSPISWQGHVSRWVGPSVSHPPPHLCQWMLQKQLPLRPPHGPGQRAPSDGPDWSVWAGPREWRVAGGWLGAGDSGPGCGHRASAPGFSAPFIKMSAASLLPSQPFTKPTFLCTLNSSQPVKAPNQTRRDFIPFSLNLPQAELVCLYPQLLSLTLLPSPHPSRMLLWEESSLWEAQPTAALNLCERVSGSI